MKKGIYRKLALSGIRKNSRLYLPYILTCAGTVMMCYIISFLSQSSEFGKIPGGNTVQGFLSVGIGVMAVFSLIFLFYTNSFLIRRRKKELGLYNILGLGKRNLAAVLAAETLTVALVSIAGGLLSGILFSKLAELCLVRILGGSAKFTFTVSYTSVVMTAIQFAGIFLVIYLYTLLQIRLTNPIGLLKSESTGEKPPKANWFAAAAGILILGAAYYLALSVEDPVTAITVFFFAVVMVIVATYLLFISGSVTLCRILQKNKRYYYKTNHFVSVSSMAYRMKRNGAGLASICILCTMVLVMISSTVCLYAGKEDSLRQRYPRNINLDAVVNGTALLDGPQTERVKQIIEETASENGASPENILEYGCAAFGGVIEGEKIIYDSSVYENRLDKMDEVWQIFIVSLDDYNRLMGQNETLSSGETLIYTTKEVPYDNNTIRIGDGETLTVKKRVNDFADNGVDSMQIFPTLYLFVPDFDAVVNPIAGVRSDDDIGLVSLHWYYGFDLDCADETQIEIQSRITEKTAELEKNDEEFSYFHMITEGVAKERADFYGLYGGLFFLGILLGLVFISAAVLIIYYKQISEGYEDRSKFDIMQKVGMTKREIQKSINSQVLTVFFMPLIASGIHLAFAFPIIRKMLMIFGLINLPFLIMTTVACFLVFAAFYLVVYRATSRSYYRLVSGMRNDNL